MLKDNKQMQCVIFVLFLFCLMTLVFSQSVWQKVSDIPAGNTTASDHINGKIYIMGAGSNLFTEYDPATDTYKALPNMPIYRWSAPSGAAVDESFYSIGGNENMGSGFRTVHAYSPQTGKWRKVADMPTGRYELRVCACNNKLITGGAYYIPKAFEIYDPATNSWEVRSANAPPMAGQAMCSYNDKVYCFGGCYGVRTVWEYDLDTDSWSRKADMPTGRSCAAAACVKGKIYVVGGLADGLAPWSTPLDIVEAYDPQEDQWYIDYPPMPTKRFFAGACVVDSLIYVIGGFQGNMGAGAQKVNEVFNPALATGTAYDGPALNDPPLVWQLQYTGVEGSSTMQWLSPIAAVDESVAWAGGNTGVYLRTTDGGENWQHGFVPGAQNHWFCSIAAINADVAYFAGVKDPSDTRIYKTVDGGTSWELQY
ncbi:hypothetical protein JW998_17475 [candidate division KSB1 bacterium]|nr:hypothetical protein [candidate division KSB1 bacterium]